MIPGTSCLATISLSLRDKSHSPIEVPQNYLSAYEGLLYPGLAKIIGLFKYLLPPFVLPSLAQSRDLVSCPRNSSILPVVPPRRIIQGASEVLLSESRSGSILGNNVGYVYWATPLPKDQFSFFTSTRLMKTSSRLRPTRSCSSSATAL